MIIHPAIGGTPMGNIPYPIHIPLFIAHIPSMVFPQKHEPCWVPPWNPQIFRLVLPHLLMPLCHFRRLRLPLLNGLRGRERRAAAPLAGALGGAAAAEAAGAVAQSGKGAHGDPMWPGVG